MNPFNSYDYLFKILNYAYSSVQQDSDQTCQNWTEVSFIVADDWLVSADVNYSLGARLSLSLSSHSQTCGVRVNILKTDLIITIK